MSFIYNKFRIEIMMPLILLILLFGFSCSTVDPPSDNQSLSLSIEDVSCIEAWLRVTTDKTSNEIVIKQNDKEVKRFLPISSDTLIVIDSLLPNQSYNFQAFAVFNNETISASEKATAKTMDTTSHNFTFEKFEFGELGSSILNDVVIINENNIWVIGEIYLKDTTSNMFQLFNAIHWDGEKWELKRLNVNFRGNVITLPLEGIFAFSASDIWLIGSLPIHGDGENWEIYDIRATVDASLSLSKAWGTSSNDMYFVGRQGSIAHYNGQSWRKIESGTSVDIQDIWGIIDDGSSPLILCAASNVAKPGEKKILKIGTSQKIDSIRWLGEGKRVHSIWMDSENKLFVCGDGVFINNTSSSWEEQSELTFVFTERIRGKGKNDLFVVGGFGLLAHNNGVSWKEYPEAASALVYTSLDYKNDLMVTVGYTQRQAVIQFMRRN